MSNESQRGKSLFSQILHIVGLCGLTLFTALGLLYFLKGNIYLALIIAMVPLFGLYFIVNILVSKNIYRNTYVFSRDFNQSGSDVYEILLLSAFSIISVFSFFMLSHALSMEFSSKEKIVLSGKEKIMQLDSLFVKYNADAISHINTIKTDIDNRIKKIVKSKSLNDINDFESIYGKGKVNYQNGSGVESFKEIEKKKLEDKYNIQTEEKEWQGYKATAESTFSSWNRLNLSLVFFELDHKYKRFHSSMIDKMNDFVYPASMKKNAIALDNPISSLAQNGMIGNLINILIFILLNYFILVPYLSTRKTRKVNEDNGAGGIRL
jgi:hypothetical protein